MNLSNSLDFTRKKEKVVRPNTYEEKIRGCEKLNDNSKILRMFVPNAKEATPNKDFLQSTTADKTFIATNIMGSKQKRIQYSQETVNSVKSQFLENGACSSVVEDAIMKIEYPEIAHNLEADYEFLEFGIKEIVSEGKDTQTIHNTRGHKRKHIRLKSNKEFSKYICKVCGISLQTASSLRNHVMTHTGEKPHSCLYCNMTFRQSHHLTEHIRTHTGERPFECELCEDTFTTKSALKSHTKVHDEVKNYKCQICYGVFSDDLQLRIHFQKHKDKCYECSECGDKFITAARLKRHQMIHSGERPFQCEECGISFREETTLRAHMGTHLPRGPYSCSMCGEVFLRLNSLSLHKKVHNTNGTYRYVPQIIKSVQNTENSMDIILNENIYTKKCLAENSKCRHKHELTKENNFKSKITKSSSDACSCNQNTHPHELDLCFTNNNQPSVDCANNVMTEVEQEMTNIPHPDVVRDALATGTVLESQGEDGQGYLIVLPKALAEKDYTLITFPPMPLPKTPTLSESVVLQESEVLRNDNCDLLVWDNDLDSVAEVAFESEKELLPVEEIDNAKKQKKQKVSTEEEVIIHELHTNKSIKFQQKEKKMVDKKIRVPKSYECQHCGKNCKTSSNYIIHMRTHTGERPYYCDYCGIGFKQLAHLKAHVRIHTGEEPFKCSLCNAAFKQSSRLRSHQRTQHIEGKVKKKKIIKRCFVRNFYCKICDKTFLDSCYKKQHMKTHADETQNKCAKCDAIFKTKNSLRKHNKLHVDNWGICEVCGLQLKSVKDLNFHKQSSHSDYIIGLNKEESFVLDEIKFEGKYDVTCSDEVKENIMKPVITLDNDQLNINKGSIEDDSKPSENVKNGSITTNISKQYQCTVCKKFFKQNSNLKTHMRMHTDERPYKCNDCGSAFRQISHLKDHVKMHTGEKPFKCSGCSAAFTQSSAVKYHIKKYHQGKAHVMKEQKNTHLPDKEFIFLEEMGNLNDDTVVISIENSVSVSIEHKISEKDAEIMKDEKKEHCNKCGKDIPICSLRIHRCIPNKNRLKKCEVCKRSFRKNYNHVRKSITEEEKHICSRCATHEASPNILIPSISCKEETGKEITGNHIDNTDHTEYQRIFNGSHTKIDMKTCNEKSFEIFKGISELSNCVESCSKLGDSGKDLRRNRISGNICNICGKVFRRASALKFHKRMSHRNNFEEESLPLNCRGDNFDLTKDVKVKTKCLSKLIKETPLKKQELTNFPPLIKEETEDMANFIIEYCKCSFCGEKLSNISKLNEHVSKLHPEEKLNEKLQTDKSNTSTTPVSNTSVTHKKNKKTRKIKNTCKSSNVTNPLGREIYLNENSRYKCQGCEKSFTRVAKLKDHMSSWCKVKKNIRDLYTGNHAFM
ncbi:zinc finger protein 721 [Procambarus clarkii]|uniref:zinc finger protein 721 n=1 Tax=Procambarus clarkii TaxID=6728 RepID=UPI001E670712|nr:zinc finger protein 91-like [Procambarus clarkii]